MLILTTHRGDDAAETKGNNMTKEQALAIFNYWFERDGHWMFGTSDASKSKAMAAWKSHGIDGLPNWAW